MSRKIIKSYNRFLAFLLSILGIGSTATFTACDNITGGCEYGTPHADFRISGTVSNKTGNEISGIKVKIEYDSTYTNSEGKYNITAESFPGDQTFPIQFIDVDGDNNGKLQAVDTTVVFENPEFENGSGNWYEGETSKTFNVSMQEED